MRSGRREGAAGRRRVLMATAADVRAADPEAAEADLMVGERGKRTARTGRSTGGAAAHGSACLCSRSARQPAPRLACCPPRRRRRPAACAVSAPSPGRLFAISTWPFPHSTSSSRESYFRPGCLLLAIGVLQQALDGLRSARKEGRRSPSRCPQHPAGAAACVCACCPWHVLWCLTCRSRSPLAVCCVLTADQAQMKEP